MNNFQTEVSWQQAVKISKHQQKIDEKRQAEKLQEFLGSKCDLFSSSDWSYYVEETGKVYFARFQTTGDECAEIARNYLTVYPEIYEYSISDNTTKLVFPALPPLSSSVSDFEINSILDTTRNYTPQEVHTPNIAYNKRNDIFKLTYIINDMNDMTHMIDASFKMVDNILTLIDVYKYEDDGVTRTTTFGLSTMFGSISAANGSFTRNQATFELTV